LSLPFYQRRRDDWKAKMAAEAADTSKATGANSAAVDKPASKKRKEKEVDVIDEVFAGKKVKVAESTTSKSGAARGAAGGAENRRARVDAGLDVVLGAIKASKGR
jgi:hypothetical protein